MVIRTLLDSLFAEVVLSPSHTATPPILRRFATIRKVDVAALQNMSLASRDGDAPSCITGWPKDFGILTSPL